MANTNPVMERLDLLSEQWEAFATDGEPRLLLWQLEPDEVRMIDAFLAREGDERTGVHTDVFLTLEAPFEHPETHGYALCQEMAAGYLQNREALMEAGVDASFQLEPYPEHPGNDIPFLIRTCESFIAHHDLGRNLVLVLRPKAVADAEAYQLWLHRFVLRAPPTVRAIVLDDADAPAFLTLATTERVRVRAVRAGLDMPAVLEAVSRDAGNLETPGGQIRHHLIQLGAALKKGDVARALTIGNAAIAIATQNGLWHAAVPVHFALGAGLAGAQRLKDAEAQYAAAEAVALRGEHEGPEEARSACATLRVQARLGLGSVLIAARAFERAAELYEQTTPLATALGPKMVLDCQRLACFCYEQAEKPELALRAGTAGLATARAMDEATLAASTFSYLAENLLRLTERGALAPLRPQIEREIALVKQPREAPATTQAAAVPS